MANLLTSYITTSLASKVELCGVFLVMHIKEREHLTNRGVNGLYEYMKKNLCNKVHFSLSSGKIYQYYLKGFNLTLHHINPYRANVENMVSS